MKTIIKILHFRKYVFEFVQYALALALSFYGFYLLSHGHEANSSSANETITDGFIENPRNDVRFKTPQDLDWNLAEDKTSIHYGDSIFTGEDSEVNVNLKSLLLSLEANTLIIINQIEKTFSLNLAKGSLQMAMPQGQGPLFIQVGLEKFKIINKAKSSASFVISNSLQKNSENKIGLSVDQGSLQFETEKGDIIEAESGQNVIFKTLNGHVQKIDKFNFQIINPTQNKLFILNEIIPVSFSWTGSPNAKFTFKISTDMSMRSSDIQEIQPTPKGNIFAFKQKGIPAAGNYFLQMESLTPSGLQFKTAVLPLHIIELRPPMIYDSTIKYLDPVRSTAALQFERISFLDHFEVQFSRDQKFTNIFKSENSFQSNPKYVIPESGQVFLRARYRLQGIELSSPWSEIVSIDIPLPMPAPKVRIASIDLKNQLALLDWPIEPRAQSYEVAWLGKNPQSRAPAKSLVENSISISLKKRTPQILTVTAYANPKIKSLSSSPIILPGLVPEPKWVSFVRTAPPLGRVESKAQSKVELHWILEFPTRESVLEISTDKFFQSKKTYVVSGPEMTFLSEANETIYARVKEQVPADEYLAEYSSIAILGPQSAPSINPPNLTLPKNDETILFPKNFAAAVDLIWGPCPGAFGYDLELGPYSIAGKTNPSVFKVVKSKYVFLKPPPGQYQWRVRCFDRFSQSNWGPYGRFKIIYGI